MNWSLLRLAPWLDTRARFVAGTPRNGSLLDLGSSDGGTLRHFAELRPDLQYFAADLAGQPAAYPGGCQFHRADLQKERLPWPDASMDAVTCMHLVEHLHDLTLLINETARLLKPGGRVYVETPHPRSLNVTSSRNQNDVHFTLNFYDDPTHIRVVTITILETEFRRAGLSITGSGVSRNWLFAASWPIYAWMHPSRQKYTAYVHWLGWSAWIAGRRQT